MHIHDDALVPAWFAADRMGVSRQTINYWRTSGKLPQAADPQTGALLFDQHGHRLYRYVDVRAAERSARRSGKAHRRTNRLAVALAG